MKNVKFRGKKTKTAENSAAQITRQKPEIPRHSAGGGKLWALVMTCTLHTGTIDVTNHNPNDDRFTSLNTSLRRHGNVVDQEPLI